MPMEKSQFNQINVKLEKAKLEQENPELKKYIKRADMEYQFIRSLVKLRKELGITQNEISERSGLTQQVISRIETYDSLPTLRTLLKYIDSMDLEIEIKKKEDI